MNTIGKSILVGLLFGAALFLLPFFLLRLFLFFALIGLAFRLIRGRRPWGYGRQFAYGPGHDWSGHAWRGGRGVGPRGGFYQFADHIRQMNDEEYDRFKQRGGSRCGQPATAPADRSPENVASDATSKPNTDTTNA